MWCRELEKNNTTLKHRYSDCPIKMTTYFIRELSDMLLFETMALHHVFFVTCLFHCLSKFSSSYSSVAGGERAHTLSPVLTVTSTLETSLSNTSVRLVLQTHPWMWNCRAKGKGWVCHICSRTVVSRRNVRPPGAAGAVPGHVSRIIPQN